MKNLFDLLAIAIGVVSWGGENTKSNVKAPGVEKKAKNKTLNTGPELLQDKALLDKFNAYLNGFHFYHGNINTQMEAHHYVHQ